jgi:flagellar biosynthesis/type III secretory pathway protein FliH
MVTYDDTAIERLIDKAVDRVGQRLDKKLDERAKQAEKHQDEKFAKFEKHQDEKLERKIQEAAERGAGIYYEKTKYDIDLVLESTGFIKTQLENMVTRDEFNELKDEVKLIRLAVTDTNKDLNQLKKPGWFPGKR